MSDSGVSETVVAKKVPTTAWTGQPVVRHLPDCTEIITAYGVVTTMTKEAADTPETVASTDTVSVSVPESTTFAFGSKGAADPVERIIEQIKGIHQANGWTPA